MFCFDFLSRTVKTLLAVLNFSFVIIYYSALFRILLQQNVLYISLMPYELIAVENIQNILYLTRYCAQCEENLEKT